MSHFVYVTNITSKPVRIGQLNLPSYWEDFSQITDTEIEFETLTAAGKTDFRNLIASGSILVDGEVGD